MTLRMVHTGTLDTLAALATVVPAILKDPSQAPIVAATLTFLGAAGFGALSWGLKTYLCHQTSFMKRKKRIIDELGGVVVGILLFCAVTTIQYAVAAEIMSDAGKTLIFYKDTAWLAIRLSLLSTTSLALFVAATAFRTPLAKIDQVLRMEKTGHPVPPHLNCTFPRTKKIVILALLVIAVFWQCRLTVGVLASSLDLLRAL